SRRGRRVRRLRRRSVAAAPETAGAGGGLGRLPVPAVPARPAPAVPTGGDPAGGFLGEVRAPGRGRHRAPSSQAWATGRGHRGGQLVVGRAARARTAVRAL